MKYSDKLKSPQWQKRRLEILQRDNFTCQICTDIETELHVHHKKYTGEPYEAPDEDLVTLCSVCYDAETIANKSGLKLISGFKIGNDYFGKLTDGALFVSKVTIFEDEKKEIKLIVYKPKELAAIINSMF